MRYLLGAFLLFSLASLQANDYLYEDFSTSTRWFVDLKYGLDGLLFPGNDSGNIAISGGNLNMDGRPQTTDGGGGNWDFNSFFVGRVARMNNTFSASPTQPFGFTVQVSDVRINCYDGPYWNFTVNSIWLVEQEADIVDNNSTEWSRYENAVFFYQRTRDNDTTSTTGVFNNGWNDFDLSQAERPNGESMSLEQTGGNYFSMNDLVSQTMTGPWYFKLTHDGSTVRFYMNVNPNSDSGNDYPNEFLKVGETTVFYSNNLQIMIGQQNNVPGGGDANSYVEAIYDDLLIRSVTSGTGYYFKGRESFDELRIIPTINSRDAGIAEVVLRNKRPKEILAVFNEYGDQLNDGELAELKLVHSEAQFAAGTAFVFERMNAGKTETLVRFYKPTPAKQEVIQAKTRNKNIIIHTKKTLSPHRSSIYVDNQPYAGEINHQWATVGREKVYPMEILGPNAITGFIGGQQ